MSATDEALMLTIGVRRLATMLLEHRVGLVIYVMRSLRVVHERYRWVPAPGRYYAVLLEE